jgi:YHS domain-containing protein
MKHHEGHTERVTEIKDPVCGMNVKDNSISHVHEGETYSFCSENCKEKFVGNPTDFIK